MKLAAVADSPAGTPPRHYRRAALAGGLIAVLLLALRFVDDRAFGGEEALPAVAQPAPPAPAAAAEPAAAPEPPSPITSISIPPPPVDAAAAAPTAPATTAPDQPESSTPPQPAAAAEAPAKAPDTPAAACESQPAEMPAASTAGLVAASDAGPPPGNGYFIQLGVFGALANAESLRQELAAKGASAYLESRVVVGPFPNRKAAEAARTQLRHDGHSGVLVPPRKP